jgi:hypothetical protein
MQSRLHNDLAPSEDQVQNIPQNNQCHTAETNTKNIYCQWASLNVFWDE